MKLTFKQKAILYGLVLGDGYLQRTGEKNARLRLEHSYNQKEYMYWKYDQLKNVFADKPKKIARIHPKTKQTYKYLRLQSHSSPIFGKLHTKLYDSTGKRKVTEDIKKLLKHPLSLAVWYMDDGYYYRRDKSAHIYIPLLPEDQIKLLIDALLENCGLMPGWYCRPDRKGCQLNFVGKEKDKLFDCIRPYILPCFNYKLP